MNTLAVLFANPAGLAGNHGTTVLSGIVRNVADIRINFVGIG